MIEEYQKKKIEEEFHDPSINQNNFKIVEVSTLATSLGGMEVPMLTITDFGHTKK